MAKKHVVFSRLAVGWLIASLVGAYLISLTILRNGLPLPVSFYLVQSGSMEPAINPGDVVVVQPQLSYQPRSVITFYDQDNQVVTHRIVQVNTNQGRVELETKGDANDQVDSQLIPIDQVIGKVVFILPRIGFLVSFAKTRYGALLLIIVPAVIIIYDEFRKMKNQA